MGCLVWLMGLVYRVRGSATIPADGFPTVTLSTAAVVGVCIHQVVMLGKHPPIGQGLVLTSLEVVASGLVVFHADSMAPLGGVWGVKWTVRQLSVQDLEIVQDHPILPNLSVDELVCLDGEQALRLCPGLAVDGFPGVRGDEDGEAGLIEIFHAVSLQGQRVQLGVLRDRLGGGTR